MKSMKETAVPNKSIRSILLAAGVAGAMLALPAQGQEAAQAVWKAQEIQFRYQITGGSFSCDGFEIKMKRVLKALGAVDPEVEVDESNCGAAARQPLVTVKLRTPVEAGNAAEGSNEAPFAAEWKRVSLSRGRLGLDTADCVMVDHLKQIVLPKLAARVVDDKLECISSTIAATQPKFVVEVLVAK